MSFSFVVLYKHSFACNCFIIIHQVLIPVSKRSELVFIYITHGNQAIKYYSQLCFHGK